LASVVIEQRRTKRFEMELPVEIIRTGTVRISAVGTTRNISSGGILFVGEKEMEVGGPVEYVVTLTSGHNGAVNLRCMGKVLRQQRRVAEESEESSVVVAVSLERYEFQRPGNQSQMEVA
jgi:hypothetical protein